MSLPACIAAAGGCGRPALASCHTHVDLTVHEITDMGRCSAVLQRRCCVQAWAAARARAGCFEEGALATIDAAMAGHQKLLDECLEDGGVVADAPYSNAPCFC